jgi:hypothetical protein
MKSVPKFIPILVVGILALTSLAVLTSAWGHSSGERHHGSKMSRCEGPHSHMRHKGGPQPDHLAMRLSAIETKIGIRANQLDVWRDFTDALQATMKRPDRSAMFAESDKDKPFALAQRLADNAIARAQSAEALKKAIEALRGALTPEQLTKIAEIEAKFRSRHHGRFDRPLPRSDAQSDGLDGPGDGPDSSED